MMIPGKDDGNLNQFKGVSSGRHSYAPPKLQERTQSLSKYVNESNPSSMVEEPIELQKKRGKKRQKDVGKQRRNRQVSIQESDHGIHEEFKMQGDDKSSTRVDSSKGSIGPLSLINTDNWALSYARANNSNAIRRMAAKSIETALFLFLEWLPFIISLHFVGTTENSIVTGGFGLGIVWSNSFIEFIFGGLGLGVQILVAHAQMEKRPKMALNLFKRGIALVTTAMLPLIVLMIISGDVITLISGDSDLGKYTQQYCTYGIPAFYLNGIYNILKGYFRARNENTIPLLSIAFSALSSILWNWIFILKVGFSSEAVGAAVARDVTEAINVVILFFVLYLKYRKEKDFSLKFSKQAFKDWQELTKFCLPIGGLLFLEWIGYEIFTFQAVSIDSSEFTAHVILNIFNTVYYQVAFGIAIVITSYVNIEMRNENIEAALRYSKIGILGIFLYILLTVLPMAFLKVPFSQLYSKDADTQQAIQDIYGLFLVCLAMDAILAGIVGIVRGIGKQRGSVLIFIASFFVIGQVLASVFIYVIGGGLVAVWLAIQASVFLATISQIIWTGMSDWKRELRNFKLKLNNEANVNKSILNEKHKSVDSLLIHQDNYEDEIITKQKDETKSGDAKSQQILEKEENSSTINQHSDDALSSQTLKAPQEEFSLRGSNQSKRQSNKGNFQNSDKPYSEETPQHNKKPINSTSG